MEKLRTRHYLESHQQQESSLHGLHCFGNMIDTKQFRNLTLLFHHCITELVWNFPPDGATAHLSVDLFCSKVLGERK
jgi:hypothetical protein